MLICIECCSFSPRANVHHFAVKLWLPRFNLSLFINSVSLHSFVTWVLVWFALVVLYKSWKERGKGGVTSMPALINDVETSDWVSFVEISDCSFDWLSSLAFFNVSLYMLFLLFSCDSFHLLGLLIPFLYWYLHLHLGIFNHTQACWIMGSITGFLWIVEVARHISPVS